LFAPPFWDDIIGVHTQAVWLARHDFDMGTLLRMPSGSSTALYNLTNPLIYFYGLCYKFLSRDITHFIAHIINIASAAGCCAVLFVLLRSRGVAERVLYVCAGLSSPLIIAACAGTGQETPLAFLLFLSICFRMRKNTTAAWILAVCCCCFKLTSIVLIGAYGAEVFYRQFKKKKFYSRHIISAVIVLLCCIGGYFWHFSALKVHLKWKPDELVELFLNAYYLLLPLLLVSCYLLVKRKRWQFALPVVLFLIFYYIANAFSSMVSLPRYGIIIVFPTIYLFALAFRRKLSAFRLPVLAGIVLLQLSNINGALLPSPALYRKHEGSFLERSREFTVMRRQDQEFCKALERDFSNTPLVCTWPLLQMLTVPEFGYVDKALKEVYAGEYFHSLGNVQKMTRKTLEKNPVFLYTPDSFNWRIPARAEIIFVSDQNNPLAGYILYRLPKK
jgi:hypothetical protein